MEIRYTKIDHFRPSSINYATVEKREKQNKNAKCERKRIKENESNENRKLAVLSRICMQ